MYIQGVIYTLNYNEQSFHIAPGGGFQKKKVFAAVALTWTAAAATFAMT